MREWRIVRGLVVACLGMLPRHGAFAQGWFSDTTVEGEVNAGITVNPARPADGRNFGRLLGDYANQPTLDQIAVTFTKPVDPIGGGYGLGVNLRLLYGSDARPYNILGISDRLITSRYQVMPVFANIAVHLPWLTPKGLDTQVGIFPAPMGVEVLDPAIRPFYSLAYTTEFSTPFEHVGAMFQWHITEHEDIQFGVDTGNQTSFGRGDNNDEPAGYLGMAANGLMGGRLSFTYLTRLGPEDALRSLGPRANSAMRFWNDLNGSYRVSDAVTVTAEVNFLHDEGLRAETTSAVTWLAWKLRPSLTLNARGEIYRDNSGEIVTQFMSDTAYEQSLRGLPADTRNAPATTYGDLSLNAAWRPELANPVHLFQIRPEIRFDRSLNGTRPFDAFRHIGMVTFGADMTLGF